MSITPEQFKFKSPHLQNILNKNHNLHKFKFKINQKTVQNNNQIQKTINANGNLKRLKEIIEQTNQITQIKINYLNKNKVFQYQQKDISQGNSSQKEPSESSNSSYQNEINNQNHININDQIDSIKPKNNSYKSQEKGSKKHVLSLKKIISSSSNNQKRQSSQLQQIKKDQFLQIQKLQQTAEKQQNVSVQSNLNSFNIFSQATCEKMKSSIKAFLESIAFQIFITLITIGSLFMEDFRTIFVQKSKDHQVDVVNITFLIIFSIEIILSLTSENYFGSFFFYLDCVSTASILMDITYLTDFIYNSGGNSQQLNMLVSQSKASRAAARAVRIMKIFRLARVVKLYKSALKAKQMNQKKQKELIKQRQKARQKMRKDQNQNFQNNLQDGTNSQYKMSSNLISKHSIMNNTISQQSQRNSRINMRRQKSIINKKNSFQNENKIMNSLMVLRNKNKNSIENHKISALLPIEFIRQEPQQMQKQDEIQMENQNQKNSYKKQAQSCNLNNSLQQHKNNNQKFQTKISMIEINTKQSNISKILSDTTIKKIIIVILIIMFSVTIFDVTNYYNEDSAWDFMCKYIGTLLQSPNISIDFINKMIQEKVIMFSQLGIYSQIIAIQTPFDQLYYLQVKDYGQMRIDEVGLSQSAINITSILLARPYLTVSGLNYTSSQIVSSGFITVVFDYSSFNAADSWFSIAKIIFICLTILYLLQSFNSSITNLIVSPIEQMLQIVVNTQQKQNTKDNEKQDQQNQGQNSQFKQARYESNIVQKAIIKIRSLMSTIFGKMGMDLIYHQLFIKDSTVQDYLKSSKKRYCIYGICRIQNFTQIAEILSQDIFIFTNEIAQIVHSAVYRYGGHGVKNLKDGFLVTFALPQEKQQQMMKDALKKAQSKLSSNTYLNILSDYAVFSFTKILIRLHKQPKILQYKKDQRLLQKFGNSFQIQMNFALSLGESIQGIIGSQVKIDPIYLGGKIADVSKISTIATKYPNIILLQRQIYKCLTNSLQSYCRIMDFVKLNKYDQGNTELYILDLDLQYISPSRNKSDKQKSKQQHPDIHMKRWFNMEYLKDNIEMDNYNAQTFINGKKQLKQVLKKVVSQQTKKRYKMAFTLYASGEWIQAKQNLQEILRMTKEDFLTNRLYQYIKRHQFKNEGLQKFKPVQQI